MSLGPRAISQAIAAVFENGFSDPVDREGASDFEHQKTSLPAGDHAGQNQRVAMSISARQSRTRGGRPDEARFD